MGCHSDEAEGRPAATCRRAHIGGTAGVAISYPFRDTACSGAKTPHDDASSFILDEVLLIVQVLDLIMSNICANFRPHRG